MKPEELEDESLEPTLDVETSPMMELSSTLGSEAPVSKTPPTKYWRAQGLAEALHRDFEKAQQSGDLASMRARFYLLARYYSRTMAILRHALSERQEPLLNAALHNLISLHQPLHHMHEIAPTSVPLVLSLDKEMRTRLFEDLIVEVLQETVIALDLDTITQGVNELHLLASAKSKMIQKHIDNLVAKGHIEKATDGFTRTKRPYSAINLDRASLQALLGTKLYHAFERGDFHGLLEIASRRQAFQGFFTDLTGFSRETADLFVAASKELSRTPVPGLSLKHHADLIGSLYPRPYQHEAYVIFRGYGYKGQVIEAPTGSGKTMIGMMCIQDWLQAMSPGESILILVPTVNYQQQWLGELCYKPIGLRLAPDMIFTGTPIALEAERRAMGTSPSILVMTYTALAQAGSGIGKGGFDQNSIEMFLQGSGIQYVILDEVHKMVEDLSSVSADVARLLTVWLRDGSLRGLIGFSGTAAAYRNRFENLGLQLVYTLPAADLIAYGFVAPFAEFGVPFAYSDREQGIRDLLEEYKGLLHEFIELVGSARLREWFATISMEERVAVGRDVLRMYAGQKNRDELLQKRFEAWETGGNLNLNELALITVIQMVKNWSDKDLVGNTVGEMSKNDQQDRFKQFRDLCLRLKKIRKDLTEQIYLPDIMRRLKAKGFADTFDGQAMLGLPDEASSISDLSEKVRDGLATTIVGLYGSLKSFYLRAGEGRVDCIKSIIAAERAARNVTGVIIFDAGKRIHWQRGTAAPGYSGVAGVFAQMLGDKRFTTIAVLSSEIYLPWDEGNVLPTRIADFIKQEIMLGEIGDALFSLITQGMDLTADQQLDLQRSFNGFLGLYIRELSKVRAPRPRQFDHEVLRFLRKEVVRAELGSIENKLLARLSLKQYHLRKLVDTFFDYAIIATYFLEAHVAQLQQVSGVIQKFFVVKIAQGERKQLMYDLTSRIVDAESLPITMVIVSPWARTGWNVIKPNILIDATATRNVTAWQQLRGRAMRAMRTWDNDCYRLVMRLLGSHSMGAEESIKLSDDATVAMEEFLQKSKVVEVLDEKSRRLLLEVHTKAKKLKGASLPASREGADRLAAKIEKGKLSKFTDDERQQLVTELMLVRNKATHIYELIKAYGSAPQVRYDRSVGEWRRTDSIAAKHNREYAVSPLTGEYGRGEEHAPLMYFRDPRANLPSQLKKHLTRSLKGKDPLIVRGWLTAITQGLSGHGDVA